MCDYPNREAAMVTIRTDKDGKPTVWCDPCLSQLVTALNDGGMPTRASCCGHGTHVGSVALADGRWIVVMTAEDWAAFDSRRGTVTDAEEELSRLEQIAAKVEATRGKITDAEVEAAARAISPRADKWQDFAGTARKALEAARGARVSAENTTPTNHTDRSL